jgi:hypothetical protein
MIMIMAFVFLIPSSSWRIYVLLFALVYLLNIIFSILSIVFLNDERKSGHIIRVYKILPIKDSNIYLSYIITPFILFVLIYIIPFLFLLSIFSGNISLLLTRIDMSLHRFLILSDLLFPLIIIFFLFLFNNVYLLMAQRAKKFMRYIYTLFAILIVFGDKIKSISLDFEKITVIVYLKQFLLIKGSLFYLYLVSLFILLLIIIQIILGMKKFRKTIYEKL